MVLSDRSITRLIDEGRIVIDPYDPALMQPASLDVRVDRLFRVFRNNRYPYIDVKREQEGLTELVEVEDGDPFILHPGEFVLGSTLERVKLPDDLVARLEGKSSLGRLGLLIHSTAGFIDPGWDGHVTLELSNVANLPITIYPEMKIGQLSFVQMAEPTDHPYGSSGLGSKYQGQRGPTPSRYWRNFDELVDGGRSRTASCGGLTRQAAANGQRARTPTSDGRELPRRWPTCAAPKAAQALVPKCHKLVRRSLGSRDGRPRRTIACDTLTQASWPARARTSAVELRCRCGRSPLDRSFGRTRVCSRVARSAWRRARCGDDQIRHEVDTESTHRAGHSHGMEFAPAIDPRLRASVGRIVDLRSSAAVWRELRRRARRFRTTTPVLRERPQARDRRARAARAAPRHDRHRARDRNAPRSRPPGARAVDLPPAARGRAARGWVFASAGRRDRSRAPSDARRAQEKRRGPPFGGPRSR